MGQSYYQIVCGTIHPFSPLSSPGTLFLSSPPSPPPSSPFFSLSLPPPPNSPSHLPLFHFSLSLSLSSLPPSLFPSSLSPLSPPSFPRCAINGLSYSVSHLDISSEQQLTGRWSIFSVFSHQCWRQDSPGGLKQ